MKLKYFIKTFGCQQNVADSERIERVLKARGMKKATSYKNADYIVINTCMIRESAENRVYGLINNLSKLKIENCKLKIVITGCMVGLTITDKSGRYLKRLREKLPAVDEFMPIEEVGFDHLPLRHDKINALVPISNGCNNFCTYCVVPFARGREVSRSFNEIIDECKKLKKKGYKNITLLGQNVNSYGADIIKKSKIKNQKSKLQFKIQKLDPIYVKHLGKYRIPTLFPHLLQEVAKLGFEKVDFISSNPWDFSDELINVIAKNKNITRTIHLPVQSGDDNVLKRMNRWYTAVEYLRLISKIKDQISKIKFTTDIIVGFPGETEKEFKNTVELCKKVGFEKAYISQYSARPFTIATKIMKDNIPHATKKKRWQILDSFINKSRIKKL